MDGLAEEHGMVFFHKKRVFLQQVILQALVFLFKGVRRKLG